MAKGTRKAKKEQYFKFTRQEWANYKARLQKLELQKKERGGHYDG